METNLDIVEVYYLRITPGGATAGYLDGAVSFISKDTDKEVLRQLMDPEAEYHEIP